MARTAHPKPQKRRHGWRIRWVDERGKRHSETYVDYDDAEFKLKEHLVEVEQVRRGLRGAAPPSVLHRKLYEWAKRLRRLVATHTKIRLPEVALAIERGRRGRMGWYHVGRDGLQLSGR